MSIKIMTSVWENSKARGTCLLLLIALADSANDEGISWPSQKTLAKKIRMSDRNVRHLIEHLIEINEISIDHRRGRSNYYKIMTPEVHFRGDRKPTSAVPRKSTSDRTVRGAQKEPSAFPPVSSTQEIQEAYEKLLGYKLNGEWATGESKAAKSIAKSYTPVQLAEAYRHYKADKFWKEKRLTLRYLSQQMPELFRTKSSQAKSLAPGSTRHVDWTQND